MPLQSLPQFQSGYLDCSFAPSSCSMRSCSSSMVISDCWKGPRLRRWGRASSAARAISRSLISSAAFKGGLGAGGLENHQVGAVPIHVQGGGQAAIESRSRRVIGDFIHQSGGRRSIWCESSSSFASHCWRKPSASAFKGQVAFHDQDPLARHRGCRGYPPTGQNGRAAAGAGRLLRGSSCPPG